MTIKEHILLAVSGMTPQIITETLYGIYIQDKSKLPTRIEVITTFDGKQRLVDNLLSNESPLRRLISDYQMPDIIFNESSIKVPIGDNGQPLGDVKTEREQEIITNFITNHVRALCSNSNNVIHASLAGGRKTMGFALGYAMSLFGRPQDILSHVLVSEPYENVPDFYYPTPNTVMRSDRDKKAQHDLSKAKVMLAKIPLVLMREEMPTQLMQSDTYSYTQTVDRINRANQLNQNNVTVKLDFARLSIHCNEIEVLLKPDCFAFYSWLAQDSQENPNEGIEAPSKEMSAKELDQRMSKFISSYTTPNTLKKMSLDVLISSVNEAMLESNHSHNWLLKIGESNENLLNDKIERDEAKLLSWHKNLWTRLLKETNNNIEHILGKKLASYYQIVTVNEEKIGKSKLAYKGLRIPSKNINW